MASRLRCLRWTAGASTLAPAGVGDTTPTERAGRLVVSAQHACMPDSMQCAPAHAACCAGCALHSAPRHCTSRCCPLCRSVGGAQFCLDTAREYTRSREQFGAALSRFQATQFKIADMATSIEVRVGFVGGWGGQAREADAAGCGRGCPWQCLSRLDRPAIQQALPLSPSCPASAPLPRPAGLPPDGAPCGSCPGCRLPCRHPAVRHGQAIRHRRLLRSHKRRAAAAGGIRVSGQGRGGAACMRRRFMNLLPILLQNNSTAATRTHSPQLPLPPDASLQLPARLSRGEGDARSSGALNPGGHQRSDAHDHQPVSSAHHHCLPCSCGVQGEVGAAGGRRWAAAGEPRS